MRCPMATATETVFHCTVTRNRETLTVVSPQGGKRLVIRLDALNKVTLTDPELSTLAPIEDAGSPNKPYPWTLTTSEAKLLAGIRDKIDAAVGTVQKIAEKVHG